MYSCRCHIATRLLTHYHFTEESRELHYISAPFGGDADDEFVSRRFWFIHRKLHGEIIITENGFEFMECVYKRKIEHYEAKSTSKFLNIPSCAKVRGLMFQFHWDTEFQSVHNVWVWTAAVATASASSFSSSASASTATNQARSNLLRNLCHYKIRICPFALQLVYATQPSTPHNLPHPAPPSSFPCCPSAPFPCISRANPKPPSFITLNPFPSSKQCQPTIKAAGSSSSARTSGLGVGSGRKHS